MSSLVLREIEFTSDTIGLPGGMNGSGQFSLCSFGGSLNSRMSRFSVVGRKKVYSRRVRNMVLKNVGEAGRSLHVHHEAAG